MTYQEQIGQHGKAYFNMGLIMGAVLGFTVGCISTALLVVGMK